MTAEQPRVAVTGASGYVGTRLSSHLRSHGLQVIELGRRSSADSRPFVLGEDVPPGTLAGVDVLVHCAYDFVVSRWDDIKRVNVDGSLKLFDAARAEGVGRIIFISTLSAFQGCQSMYGRAKLMVEDESRRSGAIVIRPGLVYDDGQPGGMVGALSRLVSASPVVPLVGGGRQHLYLSHSEDLGRLVRTLSGRGFAASEPIAAAGREGMSFRDILRAIARRNGKQPLFVSVPTWLPLTALRLLETAGLRMRLRSDSLISLVNQNPRVDFSILDSIGVPFRTFEPASVPS